MTTFNDSKYTRWYLSIITKVQEKKRTRENDVMYEYHHVLPRSVFPEFVNLKTFPWNGVLLTPREHFICHILLTRMFDDPVLCFKMHWALHRMAYSSLYKSRMYEKTRISWSKVMSENHHSCRIEGWSEKMSNMVLDSWKDNDERRKSHSEQMKLLWTEKRDIMKEHNRKNSMRAFEVYKEKNKYKIEYNGKFYYSWENLKKETGCSKLLYRKYYLNGIDPRPRIGVDGPPKGTPSPKKGKPSPKKGKSYKQFKEKGESA